MTISSGRRPSSPGPMTESNEHEQHLRYLSWRMAEDGTDRIHAHEYLRSRFSGAGNCWCGRPEVSPLHPTTKGSSYTEAEGLHLNPSLDMQ